MSDFISATEMLLRWRCRSTRIADRFTSETRSWLSLSRRGVGARFEIVPHGKTEGASRGRQIEHARSFVIACYFEQVCADGIHAMVPRERRVRQQAVHLAVLLQLATELSSQADCFRGELDPLQPRNRSWRCSPR